MKKFLALLLLPFTLCADLVLLDTITFDIDQSLSFNRPNWNDNEDIFYYNILEFSVDTAGDWRAANSSILSNDSFDYTNYQQQFERNPWFNADTYIYLYEGSFTPTNPSLNLIAQNDDGYNGGNDVQFDLTTNLKKDTTYYSVITTYDPEELIEGSVDIYGPQGGVLTYTIIPEPATYGLIMGGALTILLLRKRHV